jgi:ribonuclease HI
MPTIELFTDGSVNTKTKIGVGAYLVSSNTSQVQTKVFENTSSTKLELQTLLWALNEIQHLSNTITVYTDSQNIVGLLGRRQKLEKNNYISKNGKQLNNYDLYQKFYSLFDRLNISIQKVKGHKATINKDEIDKLFTIVDRASRNALRKLTNLP